MMQEFKLSLLTGRLVQVLTTPLLILLTANVPGKQQIMSEVLKFLIPTWESHQNGAPGS